MKIQELTLLTNNLIETQIFYENTIGFHKVSETDTSVSFAVGTSKLIFELTEENQNPKYHFAFNIPTNLLNEAIQYHLYYPDSDYNELLIYLITIDTDGDGFIESIRRHKM